VPLKPVTHKGTNNHLIRLFFAVWWSCNIKPHLQYKNVVSEVNMVLLIM